MTDIADDKAGRADADALKALRVAIVHPFLISQGGGEKVVDALCAIFPQAELFALLVDRGSLSPILRDRVIHASVLNRIPQAHRRYQQLSPLYDWAVSHYDLSGFDLVISSGGPGAKTARVPQGTVHVHYCHSPVRYLWDQYDTWVGRLPAAIRPVFALSAGAQRRRDFAAAQRIDAIIANSDYIGARITRYYQRDSHTIYPPVALARAPLPDRHGDYYLTVGRLVPGKRTELLIEACNRLGRRLVVVGGGPEEARLRALVGPTVEMTGRISDDRLKALYREARAFLFAADEDFGIATVEAQSYGLPTIAFGHGGSLEILSDGSDGAAPDAVFFGTQTSEAVAEAILRFEAVEAQFDRQVIQARAERFSEAVFEDNIRRFVVQTMARAG